MSGIDTIRLLTVEPIPILTIPSRRPRRDPALCRHHALQHLIGLSGDAEAHLLRLAADILRPAIDDHHRRLAEQLSAVGGMRVQACSDHDDQVCDCEQVSRRTAGEPARNSEVARMAVERSHRLQGRPEGSPVESASAAT